MGGAAVLRDSLSSVFVVVFVACMVLSSSTVLLCVPGCLGGGGGMVREASRGEELVESSVNFLEDAASVDCCVVIDVPTRMKGLVGTGFSVTHARRDRRALFI